MKRRAMIIAASSLMLDATAQATPDQRLMDTSMTRTGSDAREADLPWQDSGRGMIGGHASVSATPEARYLPATQSTLYLAIRDNPEQFGQRVVAPPGGEWFATYSYVPSGHVVDDERLDSGRIMASLVKDEIITNGRRRAKGLPELHIVGWEQEPLYDSHTNSLQWGLRIRSDDGQEILNRTIRILGREGMVSGTLVVGQGLTTPAIVGFDRINRTIRFENGSRYVEFREGDRIAQYGLGALVTGSVGAVAIKTGAAQGLFAALFTGVEGLAAMLAASITAILGGLAAARRRFRESGRRVE